MSCYLSMNFNIFELNYCQVTFTTQTIATQTIEYFIKGYNKHSNEGYVVEVDVQYPKKFHQFHNNLLLLPEQLNIKNVEKLVANWHDKKEHLVHIQILKEALNHGLVLIKAHRTIKLRQKKT